MRHAAAAIRESIVKNSRFPTRVSGFAGQTRTAWNVNLTIYLQSTGKNQPRRRALLLLLAGLIRAVTLTEKNRLDIGPSEDYAGTNAQIDLVLPKTENCTRSMRNSLDGQVLRYAVF